MLAPGGPPRVAGAPLSVSPAPALPASLPARIAGLLRIASGPLDGRTLIVSLLGAGLYLLSGWASLLLALAGDGITPVWLPNALAVLLLLRARLRHEWLFLGLAFCASLGANAVAQQPWPVACLFSLANLAEIMVVLALTANAYPEDIAAARAAGMQAHLAKPIALAQLVRALQRWLPTTIVEDPPVEEARTAAAAAAASLSPRLVARWEARRHEAVEAVRGALRDGTLAAPQAQPRAAERLALLLHKVAGTAGMFGEAALGEAAAALERALGPENMGEQAGETCVTLAREWLALADRPSDTEPRSASRAAG